MMAQPLPALRNDLVIAAGPAARDGAPTWTLVDPIRNRYFALEDAAVRLLRGWHLGLPDAVLAAARREGAQVGPDDVTELARFLEANDLLSAEGDAARRALAGRAERARAGSLHAVLQRLLFVRVPLLRPDRALTRVWPFIRPLAHRGTAVAIAAAGCAGLFLAMRDWDRFAGEAASLVSPGGATAFAVTLLLVKVLHELGHAFAAKAQGLRVHTMGVTFLVFVPVLYTDVSDVWLLPDRRRRLAVGAAGVGVELAIACLATLAWSFLPPGFARDAAFLLATTTWAMTLLVNLNPLMRFDGYFLLSDLLRVPNLQARAFAFGRWRMRQALFGWADPAPEPLDRPVMRALLAWCYAAWLWRLVVFVGIAVAVYHLLPKAIGLPLLALELGWFVAWPVIGEIGRWWERRREMRLNARLALTLTALTGALVLLALPWPLGIGAPARSEAALSASIFPPTAARIASVAVREGQTVKAGDVLMRLESPDLDHRAGQAARSIALAQLQLQRLAGVPEGAARAAVIEERLAADLAAWRGFADQARRLAVVAPHDGIVRDLARGLAEGRWVSGDTRLMRVVGGPIRVEAYLEGQDARRLAPGMRGQFVPADGAQASRPVTLLAIAPAASETIDIEALASVHGGPVPAERAPDGRIVPARAVWKASFAMGAGAGAGADFSAQPGTVRLSAAGEAPVARLWRRIAAIIVRESGF